MVPLLIIISHYIPLKTPLYPIKKPCSKPPTRILIPINIHQISGDMDGRFNPYHQIIIPKREEFPTNKKTDGVLLGSFHIPSLVIFLWSNDFIVDISMIQFLENINYQLGHIMFQQSPMFSGSKSSHSESNIGKASWVHQAMSVMGVVG